MGVFPTVPNPSASHCAFGLTWMNAPAERIRRDHWLHLPGWHSSDASVMLGALPFPFSVTAAPDSGGHTQLVLRL